jgi:hypothetical protein
VSQIDELVQKTLELPTDSIESDLAFFAEIRKTAGADDVSLLLEATKSDRANFWIREVLAETVCFLGGPRQPGRIVQDHLKSGTQVRR